MDWSIADVRSSYEFGTWGDAAGPIKIRVNGTANLTPPPTAPVFADATATREVPENSAADTAVGAPVTADDADGDTLEYTLGGTDASSFDIDSGTGQIKTVSSGTYNYEAAQNTYSVTVTASDGTDNDSIVVTINLTDVDEQPDKPDKPTVTAVSGSSTSLDVSWTEPGLNGGPEIIGYGVRYQNRPSPTDPWGRHVDWPHTGTTTMTTITGLTATAEYRVQVTAFNGEIQSAWSDPTDVVTPNEAGPAPTPTVTSVAVVSAPQSGDTYRLYETMRFAVTFSHPVQVDKPGPLRLEVGLDNPGGGSGSTVKAVFSGQSSSPTVATPQISLSRYLHFHYKVQLFDGDADGVEIGANALRLASEAFAYKARILSEAGTDAELDHAAVGPLSGHKVDGSADVPEIEGIEVVSTPRLLSRGADEADTYGEDEIIRIEVRFDDPVQVEGEPTFALEVGDPCVSVCKAFYESGSGTDTLVFAYLVLEVDHDHNGIAIPADPIEVVYGDSIRNEAGHEAHLSYGRKGTQPGHKTDGSRTAPSYFSVEDAEAHESDGKMEFTVRLEPHGLGIVTVDYATADGTGRNAAMAGSDYTQTSGTLRFNSLRTERTVSVPITDDTHPDDGETFTLTLLNPRGARLTSGDAEATGTIRNSEPLTATFPESVYASASHGGADDRPQAVVAFSEAVAEFGADTPSVSVTGGTVASVQPHAEDGQEHAWIFFLAPDGDGAVTFALVADAACAAGGICTSGGRALKEVPAAATIPGPEETAEIPGPEETAEPALTASFEDMPAEHDGESAFRFRVAFSDGISISYTTMRDASFTVTGGDVTQASRVDGRRDLWRITIEPDSDEAVTVRLPETTDCAASGAICTGDGRGLSQALSATIAGPPESNTAATGTPEIGGTPQVGEELTVSTSGISDADGLADASFGYQWIRADTDIQGATGATYTPVAADEGTRLKVRVSFTDDAGNDESLTSAATDAVAARPEPLTASFEGMPAEHAGQGSFSFRVAFSEGISVSYKTVRDASFTVTGGDVTAARRVDKRRDLWKITIEPDSHEAVSVRLPETTDCDASGAICTGDGGPLSHSLSATVAGPVGIAVADARVEEGDGVALAFAVTLSRAASAALTVDYATADGSAHAGDDYTAASGTLRFAAGERSKTIEVGVLDDAHDEGEETLTLTLSNASSGRLTDGEATGTIENHDPMPRALLARFGRTAAVHVVEHVEERLAAPREPGFRGRFAGRELRRGMERDVALNFLRGLGGMAGATPTGAGAHGSLSGAPAAGTAALGMPGSAGGGGRGAVGGGSPMGGAMAVGGAPGAMGIAPGPMGGGSRPDGGFNGGGGLLRMGLGGGDVLTGSNFALARETRHGGILSFWSRGAQSHFSGREGALSLGGDVRTTMFGADYAKGPLVTGLSLSHSRGLGEYTGIAGGQVASSVTGLYPWLGYKATERVTVWGVAGYGAGGMMLTPQGGPALESGLSMAMAAAGTRGELVAGGASAFELAFKADALWVGTSIDGVDGPAGRLKATAAAVTRFRTGLEGSRAYTFGGRLSLKPSVEVGLRHDGGDAETGAGMDVGAGMVVSDASTGLAVDVRVRTLLVHQDQDFSERGVSLSVSYNPTPSTPLGFVARVAPSWGGQATSGAQALWGRETMGGMAHGGVAQGNRLDGEVGYGLPVGRRFVGTPRVGFSTSEYGRDYRAGYGLGLLNQGSLSLELGVEAQRRNSPILGGTSNGMLGRATVGW